MGTTAGKHKPCWLIQLLLNQVLPISDADSLGPRRFRVDEEKSLKEARLQSWLP
jgi:hypothetical protein